MFYLNLSHCCVILDGSWIFLFLEAVFSSLNWLFMNVFAIPYLVIAHLMIKTETGGTFYQFNFRVEHQSM